MPNVSCSCGKTLRVPGRLIGKKAKCPRCGKILVVSADGSATIVEKISSTTRIMTFDAEESDVGLRGDSGPIRFSCLCGKELISRRGTEGQKIKCTDCGRLVKIPEESGGGVGETAGGASCPRCGVELPGGAFVCPSCKANLLTGKAAGTGCPRCSAVLEIGAIKCEQCHLNLVTGQVELPPDPEEEQVASMMQSLSASFTAPVRGLGGGLITAGLLAGFVVPSGWTGKILGLVVYTFLAFPCLRAASLGEGMTPKSRVFKSIVDEWVLPWIATLLTILIIAIPLIVAGIVFRPNDAGAGELLPSLTANIITVLLTTGTGIALPLAIMRAGGYGSVMHGIDPFALIETAKTFPLETLMSVLYLIGVIAGCAVVGVVTLALDSVGGAVLGTAVLALCSMWWAFLGSIYHRRKKDMPGLPTTAPKAPAPEPPPE
ncbi:MAG: hypothetical protein AAB434_08690 [Planctomycetota bacterium]